MADKNRNGIDDSKEKPKKRSLPGYVTGNAPSDNSIPYEARRQDARLTGNRGLSGGASINAAFPTNRAPLGGSKQFPNSPALPGAMPMQSDAFLANLMRGRGRRQQEQGPTEMSFSDMLAQAMQLFGGSGEGGGPSSVNYDPQRNSARANASEADQKIAGIYAALTNSIAGDAGGIGASYDQAKATQQAAADQAQQNVKAGYQSANDMLTQQAQALGIQEAVANQINSGQANGGDMTQRLSDLGAQNAQAQSQLGTNRQSALDYNTAVAQAARQESASRRAALASELRNILGQIDSAEQETNASLANQYSSSAGQGMDSALSLAKWMYENQTDERRHQDESRRLATEMTLKYPGTQQNNAGLMSPDESWSLIQRLVGAQDPQGLQQYTAKSPENLSAVLDQYINLIRPRG